jgi:hypothetical protein
MEKFFAKGSYKRLFEGFVDRYPELFAEGTCRAANLPTVVIKSRRILVFVYPYGVEMAADGLGECTLAFSINLLKGTKTTPLLVVGCKDTISPIDELGNFFSRGIYVANPLAVYYLQSICTEQRLYQRK